ncbi:MAG: hypothetical protein R3F59_26550 [Myxococcota bacterium]
MTGDPYLQAALRQRRNRMRAEGPLGRPAVGRATRGRRARGPVRPPLAAGLPRPHGQNVRSDAVGSISLWIAILVVSVLSLDVFSRLIRGVDRDVLSLLPIDPARVVRALLLQTAVARWWLVPCAGIVLLPVATGRRRAVGRAAGARRRLPGPRPHRQRRRAPAGHRGGRVQALRPAARRPARRNPRPQAAFLYAPGLLVLAVGRSSASPPTRCPPPPRARSLAWARLLSPAAAAVAAGAFVPGLARRAYLRGTAVVSEIDARYAALEDPREAGRVYLDWVVRFLPAPLRTFALDDLRHGWRARRSFVTGAWLLAVAAAAVGWTERADGPLRAAALAVAGAFVVGAGGVLLAADEPPFLRAWLPPRGAPGALARAVVLVLWGLPPVVLGALAVWLRVGAPASHPVWLAGGAALAVAVGLSLGAGRLRQRGLVVYTPVAAVVGVALLAWTVVGGT